MRIVFGSWKYLFKNLWYLVLFAIVPAVFLTLCLDYAAIARTMHGFFSGAPKAGFLMYFRALSIININPNNTIFGAICTVLAFISVAVFMTLMLSLVEKHMRLGKRTLNGAFSQIGNLLLFGFAIALIDFVLYEIWAIVLSAVLFVIAAIGNVYAVYVLDCVAFLLLYLIFLYVLTVFYLWFPCKQATGCGNYHSFLYSYFLLTGLRGKLILSLLVSSVAVFVIVTGLSFLPNYIFYGVSFFMFLFVFMNFGVRMETVYFTADKLDREDIIRSYRGL